MSSDPLSARISRLQQAGRVDDLHEAVFGRLLRVPVSDPSTRRRSAHSRYVACIIDRLEGDMQATQEGERNATLNRCCYKLGQLVASTWTGMDQSQARDALARLCNAAYECSLSWSEIRSTARGGYEAGLENPLPEPP